MSFIFRIIWIISINFNRILKWIFIKVKIYLFQIIIIINIFLTFIQYADGCKTDSTITQAAFNGKSFVRQRAEVIITDKNATLRIYVKLRTAFKNGIILHVYFDNERYSLVYLELGSLKFQFSCGFETMLLGEIDALIDNGFEVGIDMRYIT